MHFCYSCMNKNANAPKHARKRQITFVRIFEHMRKIIIWAIRTKYCINWYKLDLIHESTGEKTKAKDSKIVLSRESPTIKPLTPVLCHKPIFYLYPWAIWHWAAPPCSPRCRSRTANGRSSTTRSCPSVGPWMASPRDAPWRGGGWRCRPWCRSRPWWRWRRGCRRGRGASSHLESRLWKYGINIVMNLQCVASAILFLKYASSVISGLYFLQHIFCVKWQNDYLLKFSHLQHIFLYQINQELFQDSSFQDSWL